jgi:hypothetical protein
MSYRKSIFTKGSHYRVKQNFTSGPSTFISEELLVFECDGYSPYDNSFVYQFRSQSDSETKGWMLYDGSEEPSESWQEYFEPLTVAVNPTWLTSTVASLAQAIRGDRGFSYLPILADALEDAGCTNQAILEHCRSSGEHVRGCWVVDLLLAKEARKTLRKPRRRRGTAK